MRANKNLEFLIIFIDLLEEISLWGQTDLNCLWENLPFISIIIFICKIGECGCCEK